MTLTAAIVLCMAVTAALAFWAWRFPARSSACRDARRRRGSARACSARLLRGRDAIAGRASRSRSSVSTRSCSTRFASAPGPGADVRIPAPSGGRGGTGLVSVHFEPNDSSLVVRAEAGAPPVVVGDRVLGAAARRPKCDDRVVARAGTAPAPVRAAMPWWPLGCTTRIASFCCERTLTAGGVSARVRVAGERRLERCARTLRSLELPPFVLFRRDGQVYVAAGARTTLTVNGARCLSRRRATASGAIEIGIGRETSRLRVAADRRANRMHVLFGGRLRR